MLLPLRQHCGSILKVNSWEEVHETAQRWNYILDFYCVTDRIAIELDGEKHFRVDGMKYNAERTKYLNSLNIKVIQFENQGCLKRQMQY